MADPIFIDLPKNVWTKVATNVTSGQIHKKTEAPQEYLQTYRDTGGIVPPDTEEGKEQGVLMFRDDPITELISAISGIDIYVYPVEKAGKLRLDL